MADSKKGEGGNALVPSGTTLVPVTKPDGSGAIVAVSGGTALVVDLGKPAAPPAVVQDAPVAIPESKPAERPEGMMTIEEARRLITRVRRTTFFLSVNVPLFNRQDPERYRPDFQLLEVSAAQLLKLLADMTRYRPHDDRWVHVRYDAPKDERGRGFLVFRAAG